MRTELIENSMISLSCTTCKLPRLALVFLIALVGASASRGEWGQADADLAGLPVKTLQSTSDSCDLTSKGRELKLMESEEYTQDLAVRKLQNSAAILKGESDATLSEMLRVIELEQTQKDGGIELNKKVRSWLDANCLPETSLFLYTRHSGKAFSIGYCVIKDDKVLNTLILGEGREPSSEPDYTVPNDLSVDVRADLIQPVSMPIVVTLRVKNTGNKPYSYWCGGPGVYLNANVFTAKVVGQNGKPQGIRLSNGQYMMGSGNDREVKPQEIMDVPASLGVLPVGSYSIQVGNGAIAKVDVREDVQLAKKREQEILSGIYREDSFLKFLVVQFHLDPVIAELQRALIGTDIATAKQAALAFYGIHPKPNSLAATVSLAMAQQLDSPTTDPTKFELLTILAQMAGEIASDETLVPLLALLASDTMKIPDRGLSLGIANQEDAKVTAVRSLGAFKQQRATDELHRLLKDSHFQIRITAAQVLAQEKDPAGKDILRAHVLDKHALDRSGSYRTFIENFPDDPNYKSLVEDGLTDSDSEIRSVAEEAQEKRRKIQALRDQE